MKKTSTKTAKAALAPVVAVAETVEAVVAAIEAAPVTVPVYSVYVSSVELGTGRPALGAGATFPTFEEAVEYAFDFTERLSHLIKTPAPVFIRQGVFDVETETEISAEAPEVAFTGYPGGVVTRGSEAPADTEWSETPAVEAGAELVTV